ncbi:MAG TPA: hypothetical protein VLA20_09985, partial [Vicinamibacterales bacterium]|nr:hypothetical protein [Vicinamibacterales bacterium]
VKRDAASPAIQYDGTPEFAPVEQVEEVRYAVNTAASVFKVGNTYYLCDNAVWYRSASPTGPWQVATEIPSVLYNIPASNPHHNVTYVRVYDVTPQVVYVGYTPGYVGSYWSHGCVVWGTGWHYYPWYGPHYYPYPWTWGLHMAYNPWTGWGVGVSWTNGPFRVTVSWRSGPYYRPPYYGGWYGPGGYRPPYRPYPPPGYRPPGDRPSPTPLPATRPAAPGARPAPAPMPARPGIYDKPGVSDRMAPGAAPGNRVRPTPSQMPNNVFTDPSGNIYQRTPNGGWEQRQGGQWRPAEGLDRPVGPTARPSTPSAGTPAQQPRAGQLPSGRSGSTPTVRPATPRPSQPTVRPPTGGATRPQLERDSRARQRGTTRSRSAPPRAGGRGGR